VLERALECLESGTRAWLGFKVVTDAAAAVDSVDTEVVNIQGKGQGSADGKPAVFLVIDPTDDRDAAQIVASRPYSKRDEFQMLDITRGPRFHNEQYAGVAWEAEPLFPDDRVIILGSTEAAAELALIARKVDFSVIAIEDSEEYLSKERFPTAERIIVPSWDELPEMHLGEHDYVCVLTRGHMHDPEALAWGVKSGAGYVGMMGCAEKNERVMELVKREGIDAEKLADVHAPIGLKFGAVTPPELAISIVAQLIEIRHERVKASDGKN
jgi:xanthine dehydrogenase accessory factor